MSPPIFAGRCANSRRRATPENRPQTALDAAQSPKAGIKSIQSAFNPSHPPVLQAQHCPVTITLRVKTL
jgi:hypothetical protein